jgi:hypothetical protein
MGVRVSTRSLEPATGGDPSGRGQPPSVSPSLARDRGEPVVPLHWWERLRSVAALIVLAIALGGFAALAIGVGVLALFNFLRGAVG